MADATSSALSGSLKIKSFRSIGVRSVWDMETPSHSFVLENGVVAHNCLAHSASYAIIAYACAYLKHYHPLEWWTSVLKNASKDEISGKFWKYCGHLILNPDIQHSGNDFQVEGSNIRAPASLLKGIGETAHKQLLDNRPYIDIENMCQKLEDFKIRNGTPAIDKKTGEVALHKKGPLAGTPKIKKALSAVNRGVVTKLIIAGVLDSLFPETCTTLLDKLQAYEAALAKASGEKKPAAVNPVYNIENQVVRYQLKKEIMPSFSTDLRQMLSEMGLGIVDAGKMYTHTHKKFGTLRAVAAEHLEAISNALVLPDGGVTVAVATYVAAQENRIYQGNKEMCKLSLDIDGDIYEFVRWADKSGKVPPTFKKDLKFGVGVAILRKWREDKPWAIEDYIEVQPAFVIKKELDQETEE